MNTQITAQAPRTNLSFEAMLKPIICYLKKFYKCRQAATKPVMLSEHLRQDTGLRDTYVTPSEAREISRRSTLYFPVDHPIRFAIWPYSS